MTCASPCSRLGLLNGSLKRLVRDPDARDALEQQEMAIASMARLLNALLDISKLESGAIRADVADFDVTSLFEELRREFLPMATAKGLALGCSGRACSGRSDPALVGQILRNLLTNALKYTSTGEVAMRCVVSGERVLVEVADTGIGIAAEHLGAICDEFYQIGVPANARREGYGLGLRSSSAWWTCWDLTSPSAPRLGHGSVFGLSLPLALGATAAAPRSEATAPVPRGVPRKARILLVEDDPGVRDATRLLLRVEGHAVVAVATREEALDEAAAAGGFDLVVSDFHLGSDGSGLEVIQALREQCPTPFNAIIVTGDTSSAIRELPHDERLRLLSKPVHADELLALVRDLLPQG